MSTGNAEDIEEERRLLYVAMTRAKDQLALIAGVREHAAENRPFAIEVKDLTPRSALRSRFPKQGSGDNSPVLAQGPGVILACEALWVGPASAEGESWPRGWDWWGRSL
jgi:hypothetical protein